MSDAGRYHVLQVTTELIDQLSVALETTAHLVASVSADQWTNPTPCSEWSVRDVVNHLVVGHYRFASILRGQQPPAAEEILSSVAVALSAYRDSSEALLDAFRQPGVLEKMFTIPFGTVPGVVALHLRMTEALVHGWDLARATGQSADFPDHLAEQELAFSRAKLSDIPAGRTPFAPPQPVAHDAPAIDRLAACLGRRVAADVPAARSRS